ncbi:MAG: glutathione S-transferase family protein [Alphaproteobacteria bacterium]|nr:glutathione S-transferase family protein [Alphaproteobacteria bacterium]
MHFYNSVGPNPQVVRMFMAERGIEVPQTTVDLRGGENRRADYMAKNPFGQLPCLELDDGSFLAEITVICEYLDETTQGMSLIGANAKERAETRMWVRRIDLNIIEPLTNSLRFSKLLKLFESRIHVIPQAADDLLITAQKNLAWLNGQMAGKTWICGDRFTLADILLFVFIGFGGNFGVTLDPANTNLLAWVERVKARPSSAA